MIKLAKICTILTTVLALSSCGESPTRERTKLNGERFAEVQKNVDTVADARKLISNKTSRSFDRGHGNQIEYTSANGRAYLWYPGNTRIVTGRWKLGMMQIADRETPSLCFMYGTDTYNPVTKQVGGNWECKLFHIWLYTSREIRNGDPLNLQDGLPYKLQKYPELTITEAMMQNGLLKNLSPDLAYWYETVVTP